MRVTALVIIGCLWFAFSCARGDVLIVADEFPAMEVLAARLKAAESLESRIVKQSEMPPTLKPFAAVVVYIHRSLNQSAEKAFIDYANAGGRLIALHHSISSGKRTNEQWFPFLGVSLPVGEAAAGGYKWVEPATIEVVNLAPNHFITTNKVTYPIRIVYRREKDGQPGPLPGIRFEASEVYLNHVLEGPRTILLGLKYLDTQAGTTWMQDRAGWCRPVGKGWLVYLMPGHSISEFEDPAYARILINAIIWRP